MAKSLAASQKLMKNYLSELLTEETQPLNTSKENTLPEKVIEKEKLEHLFNNLPQGNDDERPISRKRKNVVEEEKVLDKALAAAKSLKTHPSSINVTKPEPVKQKTKSYREGSFQAMFFDVAGLIVAVPLIELGGIYNIDKVTSLMGKPDWFKGVMVHRDEQINVVDTALWVMPEKCDQKLKDSLNYMYIIMLSNSQWGLTAEKLIDTVTLNQEDVKWLDSPSKRPWLAGLVKDRMCALLEVESLISLLNDGFNVNNK